MKNKFVTVTIKEYKSCDFQVNAVCCYNFMWWYFYLDLW